MFPSSRLGLFDSIPCPDKSSCNRNPCLYSHQPGLKESHPIHIPVVISSGTPTTKPILKSKLDTGVSVPAKRPVPASLTQSEPCISRPISSTVEPPRKIQKLDGLKKAPAFPSSSSPSTGEPVLTINPASSKIPISVRQTCLKTLYDTFVKMYASFHSEHPHLAREHALAQEIEVYNKTNKQTYRQGVVTTVVSLKKRVLPQSPQHESVGTETECQARVTARKLSRVEAHDLEDVLLTPEQMTTWGYLLEIPDGPGGDAPSAEGTEMICERCSQRFIVRPLGQGTDEACSFHWSARPYTTTLNGEKIKMYKCCAMTHPGRGCAQGPHVFYEKTPEELHQRHPFSLSSHPALTLVEDSVLDVAALDCEMIYTTGGLRVARVSVVDGDGKEVFDEFVRMDEGVQVIDYITRFSGITPELLASAALDLASVRQALRAFIGPRTILVGHALDNDLKALRMVHHRIVDTCVLFPHRAGAPYRRALRDLASDKLQKMIQVGGGTSGHSSVEDAIATLDLVRWWIAHEKPLRAGTATAAKVAAGADAKAARRDGRDAPD